MSQTKWDAVEALPPLPQTKIRPVHLAGPDEDVDGVVDLFQIDGLDGLQDIGFVFLGKACDHYLLGLSGPGSVNQKGRCRSGVANSECHAPDGERIPQNSLDTGGGIGTPVFKVMVE
jgi:hypothetical protein